MSLCDDDVDNIVEKLKRLHFGVGVVGIIIFLMTGQYMYHWHAHLDGMADGPRMLFRSAHIYFLLTSVINLVVGFYMTPDALRHKNVLQVIISILILLAPVLVLVGFFVEPHLKELSRPYSVLGMYALFATALLIIVIAVKNKLKG